MIMFNFKVFYVAPFSLLFTISLVKKTMREFDSFIIKSSNALN